MYVQGDFRHQLTSRQRGRLVDEILYYRDGLLLILVPRTQIIVVYAADI